MPPIMPPYAPGCHWIELDVTGWLDIKKPQNMGLFGLSKISLNHNLVEAAGVEPASASTLPLALHA